MLIDLNDKKTDYLPHENEFEARCANLSDVEYRQVEASVNEFCDTHRAVSRANLNGDDWASEPWAAVRRACRGDVEEAEMFLGQILWQCLRMRSEEWRFDRPPSTDGEIRGMIYWRRE